MKQGFEDEAKILGVKVDVQAAPTEGSITAQVDTLNAMAVKNYQAYAVAPITKDNLTPALVPLSKKGIPIINVDSPIDPEGAKAAGVRIATFISSDNVQAGNLAGTFVAQSLGNKGEVAIVQGLAGDVTSQARAKGFRDAISQHPEMRVVADQPGDWSREKALNVATQILTAHPNVRAFYACNDDMALGIVKAIQNANKQGQVIVVGTDGIQQALEAIKDGQMAATVSQYPYAEGKMALEAAVALVEKKASSLPEKVTAPIKLVTKENAEEALAKFPQPFATYDDPFAALLGQ